MVAQLLIVRTDVAGSLPYGGDRHPATDEAPGMSLPVAHLHDESHGHHRDPAVVLIAGLGQQLTSWPMGFVHGMVVGGYRVTRFDNRDIGMSDRTPGGKVNLDAVVPGDPKTAPYTIETMADDTVAMMDRLGIDRAHILGYSMGGMIAQALAVRYPKRVITLTSVMSSTGASDTGASTKEGSRILYAPLPAARSDAIEQLIVDRDMWSTPGTYEPRSVAAWIAYEYDRGYDTAGVGRQIAAIRASGDRTKTLRRIVAPTLVIHGSRDPLIDVSGGRATAAAIPGATFVELDGIAHDLSQGLWPRLLGPIHNHLQRSSL